MCSSHRRAGLTVGLVAALLAHAVGAQWVETPLARQHKIAGHLAPTPVTIPRSEAAQPKTLVLRVRCYADHDWRLGGIRWQDRARAQLEALNHIIEPGLGIRLEPERFERWERQANPGKLNDVLTELEGFDKGEEVDWVFGFVTPMALATNSIHEIGMARYLGRHLVIRGMSSMELMEQFNKELDLLDRSEREVLYSERKAHKEVVVLLHEWAHTSGVLHSSDPSRIMNPTYSRDSSTFSPQDMVLLRAGLAARATAAGGRAVDWSALASALAATSSNEWFTRERDELVRILKSQASQRAGMVLDQGGSGRPPGGTWSKPDADAYNRALALFNQNKDEEIWNAIAPRTGDPKVRAEILSLTCRLVGVPALASEGPRLCQRALAEAPPDNPVPFLDAAEGALLHKDRALALTHARAALVHAAQGNQPEGNLTWLAKLLLRLDSPAWAQEALTKARASTEVDRLRAEVSRSRRIWGLADVGQPSSLPAESENLYVAAWRATMADFDQGRLKQAKTQIAAAQKERGAVPGLHTLSCELALLQRQLGPASKACNAAIAASPEQPRAHYLLAHIKLSQGARQAALQPMKRAVELDPRERPPWLELAELQRSLGQAKDARQTLVDADQAAPSK